METSSPQTFQPGRSAWIWPLDDQTPVDINISKYSKRGLSYWVGAARSIGPTARGVQVKYT